MSELLEQLCKDGEVVLERYGHQVGGRMVLFKFKDALCKPLIPKEVLFYQTAHETLQRYIPRYYGVVGTSFVRNPSGEIMVMATHMKKQDDPSVQSDHSFPRCSPGSTIHSEGASITSTKMTNGDGYINPWATRSGENMDKHLNELPEDLQNITREYIVLENLTEKFRAPSVLDLKVGTTWNSPAPINSQGVRMAGMQKFDAKRNCYTFCDKYFGKRFSDEEFGKALHFFLDNGACFRSDLLPTIIRMLEDLQDSIRTLPSFRYFSSSLLLIYDGADCPPDLCRGEMMERERVVQDSKIFGKVSPGPEANNLQRTEEDFPNRTVTNLTAAAMTTPILVEATPTVNNCEVHGRGSYSINGRHNSYRTQSQVENITHHSQPVSPLTSGLSPLTSVPSPSERLPSISVSSVTSSSPLTSELSPLISVTALVNPSPLISAPSPLTSATYRLPCAPSPLTSATYRLPCAPSPLTSELSLLSMSDLNAARRCVDVRMIDFARSSHPGGCTDDETYKGLDIWYLSGLDSLIGHFRQMLDNYSQDDDRETLSQSQGTRGEGLGDV